MSDTDAILAANAAYYRAFSTGDVAAMSRIWADEGVSCVHPGWTPLIGRAAVVDSYRNILASPSRVRIAHREDTAIVGPRGPRALHRDRRGNGAARRHQFLSAHRRRLADGAPSGEPDRGRRGGERAAAAWATVELAFLHPLTATVSPRRAGEGAQAHCSPHIKNLR